MVDDKCKKILISEEQIKAKVKEIGEQITRDYADKDLVVIGILNGCFVFMADLIREIKVPAMLDFMIAKSYNGTESTGEVRILKDSNTPIKGKDVLFVEDIIDSGITLNQVKKLFMDRGANSVKICTAFSKSARRIVKDLSVDYIGFEIPDEFVVGYGLDYNDYYRNLKDLRIYNPEEEN